MPVRACVETTVGVIPVPGAATVGVTPVPGMATVGVTAPPGAATVGVVTFPGADIVGETAGVPDNCPAGVDKVDVTGWVDKGPACVPLKGLACGVVKPAPLHAMRANAAPNNIDTTIKVFLTSRSFHELVTGPPLMVKIFLKIPVIDRLNN